MKSAHEILNAHLEAKKAKNPRFSLRMVAKKLDISPAYLSKILSGKKPLPLPRARALAALLELDALALRQLERAVVAKKVNAPAAEANASFRLEEAGASLPSESFSVTQSFGALDHWYYLPILEFVTCADFTPDRIANRLGLRREVADRAWARLVAEGLVAQENNQWKKVTRKLRFPAARIDPRIQKHHLKMLDKAAEELTYRKTAEDFARRMILGASVATNEESFLEAKRYLEESLFKAAEMLARGRGDRVYYLGMQLFPLSRVNEPDAP